MNLSLDSLKLVRSLKRNACWGEYQDSHTWAHLACGMTYTNMSSFRRAFTHPQETSTLTLEALKKIWILGWPKTRKREREIQYGNLRQWVAKDQVPKMGDPTNSQSSAIDNTLALTLGSACTHPACFIHMGNQDIIFFSQLSYTSQFTCNLWMTGILQSVTFHVGCISTT